MFLVEIGDKMKKYLLYYIVGLLSIANAQQKPLPPCSGMIPKIYSPESLEVVSHLILASQNVKGIGAKDIIGDGPQKSRKIGVSEQGDNIISGIFFNQNGYEADPKAFQSSCARYRTPNGPACKRGKSLKSSGSLKSLLKGDPIGYNIHVPKGQVSAFIVVVYGGEEKKNRGKSLKGPGSLLPWQSSLLNKGIGIITLNLPDLLKNTKFQFEMDKDVYYSIQKAIDSFYQTFSKAPQNLHPELAKYRGFPLFLYGASFGGGVSIRHAELYPNTFNGYISHDGALSLLEDAKTGGRGGTISQARGIASQWISPLEEAFMLPQKPGIFQKKSIKIQQDQKIAKIKQPILLIHNFTDKNVNIRTTIAWYNKAVSSGKGRLITTNFNAKGNPTSSPSASGVTNRGHGVGDSQSYVENILSFIQSHLPSANRMTNTPDSLEAAAKMNAQNYQARKAGVLSGKQLGSRNPEEVFLAFAYEHYLITKKIPQDNAAWMREYLPLYYAVILSLNKKEYHNIFAKLKMLDWQSGVSQMLKGQIPYIYKYLSETKKCQGKIQLDALASQMNAKGSQLLQELINKPASATGKPRYAEFMLMQFLKSNPNLALKLGNTVIVSSAKPKVMQSFQTAFGKFKNLIYSQETSLLRARDIQQKASKNGRK